MLVLCCGMFRSGSTLQYNLARGLIEAAGRGQSRGWVDQDKLSHSDLQAFATHPQMEVIKAHDLVGLDREPLTGGTLRICYSYRDLRDVAGSIKTVWAVRDDDLFAFVRSALAIFDTVNTMPHVLMQSYQELTDDTLAATLRIAGHVGLTPSADEAAAIAQQWQRQKVETAAATRRHSPVRVAKRAIRAVGLDAPARAVWRRLPAMVRARIAPVHRDASLLHAGHISNYTKQGRPTRLALTATELQRVTEMARPWLERFGYETVDDQVSTSARLS